MNVAIRVDGSFRAEVLCRADGEIVCLDEDGKPQFRDLLFHRSEPRFIVFDLLWRTARH